MGNQGVQRFTAALCMLCFSSCPFIRCSLELTHLNTAGCLTGLEALEGFEKLVRVGSMLLVAAHCHCMLVTFTDFTACCIGEFGSTVGK